MTGFDPERRAAPLVAAGAALLCAGTAAAPSAWALLAVPGLLLLGLACVSARDGFLLFGPFPKYEQKRLTRGLRTQLAVAAVPLTCGAAVLALHAYGNTPGKPTPEWVTSLAVGGYGMSVFMAFFVLMIHAVSLPLATLTGDRQSKRADFLLVTDLRGRELVIGRTLSQLAVYARYPLAAVPVVVLLPPLFEVDPVAMLLPTAYAAVTLFCLAGLGALSAVRASDRLLGVGLSGLFVLYLAVGSAAEFLDRFPAVWVFPGTPTVPAAWTVADLVDRLNVGNPFARGRVLISYLAGRDDARPAAAALPGYAAVQLTVGVLAFALAARWVRTPPAPDRPSPGPPTPLARPPVGDRPILWKETHLHPAVVADRRMGWPVRVAVSAFFWLPLLAVLASPWVDFGRFTDDLQMVGRCLPLLWAFTGGLVPGGFALHSLPRERELNTLTGLLASPLPPAEIAGDRLLAAVWQSRWALVWAGLSAGALAAVGLFPWVGVPAILVTALVMAVLAAAAGGWCGAKAADRPAAAARFGPIVLGFLFGPAAAVGLLLWVTGGLASPVRFGLIGVSPPLALGAACWADRVPPAELPLWAAGLAVGLGANAAAGVWLWRAAVRRFVTAVDPARTGGPVLTNEKER